MTKNDVKKLYNRLAVLAKKIKRESKKFDELCKEHYGFVYQECSFSIDPNLPQLSFCDDDAIIDTLDYGTDSLPFKEFDKKMELAKKCMHGAPRQ